MARFFVARKNITGSSGIVGGEEFEHLRRVLRLASGDGVTLFDDEGCEYEAVIRDVQEDCARVEVLRSYQPQRESILELTLAVALMKGEKMDWVVEKATELGVQTILPFVSQRTVPRLDVGKRQRRRDRWQKIALSAVKQSGRTRVPAIHDVMDVSAVVTRAGSDMLKLFFWEQENECTLKQVHASNANLSAALLMIGPEGGFGAAEAALAVEHGFQAVHLGRRVLRAETAAITTVALAQFLWGDLSPAVRDRF